MKYAAASKAVALTLAVLIAFCSPTSATTEIPPAVIEIANCRGLPSKLKEDILGMQRRITVSGRTRLKGDMKLESVGILVDQDSCSSTGCMHHFLTYDGGECEFAFSTRMPKDSAAPTCIVSSGTFDELLEKSGIDYTECELIFRGHCFIGGR